MTDVNATATSNSSVDLNTMVRDALPDGVSRTEAESIIMRGLQAGIGRDDINHALSEAGFTGRDLRDANTTVTRQIDRDQRQLRAFGYDVQPNGRYDDKTRSAVTAYQTSRGIEPATGVLDNSTRAVMESDMSSNQLMLASVTGRPLAGGNDGIYGNETATRLAGFVQQWNRTHGPSERLPLPPRMDDATTGALIAAYQPVSEQQDGLRQWGTDRISQLQTRNTELRSTLKPAYREASVDSLVQLRDGLSEATFQRTTGMSSRDLDRLARNERQISSTQRDLGRIDTGDVSGYTALQARKELLDGLDQAIAHSTTV